MSNPHDYALVVSAQDYTHIGRLDCVSADAREITKWLQHKLGGAIPKNRVISVVNPATATEVKNAALRVKKAAEGNEARRIYLYFSGHGKSNANGLAHFCLTGWSNDQPENVITPRDYFDAFCDSGLFQEVILLCDFCRDHHHREIRGGGRPFDVIAAKNRFVGGLVAFATQDQHKAYPMSELDGEDSLSFFTRAVSVGLWGGAAHHGTGEGVRYEPLEAFARQETRTSSTQQGREQIPEIFPVPDFPESVLGRCRAERTIRFVIKEVIDGQIWLSGTDAVGNHRSEQLKISGVGQHDEKTLPNGTYIVEAIDGSQRRTIWADRIHGHPDPLTLPLPSRRSNS